MNISQIGKNLDLCKRFADGDAELFELADALGEPLGKLQNLLSANGIIELNGSLVQGVTAQDLINTILLYYAMTSYHDFVEIAWTGRTAQSQHGVRRG